MKAQIREARLSDRRSPNLVADLPNDRLALEGKAVLLVLPLLRPQDGYCVSVQRDASRRAILRLIQPSGLPLQIDSIPFQIKYLPSAAACCQSKTDNQRHVRQAGGNEPVCFRLGEPTIPLDFSG